MVHRVAPPNNVGEMDCIGQAARHTRLLSVFLSRKSTICNTLSGSLNKAAMW
jgi:hypothetical protein